MSAKLDRLKQQERSSSMTSSPSASTNAEVIAAVNRQTKVVNDLKTYLRIAIEETVKQELSERPSTSHPCADTLPRIESVESRLAEIEMTLRELSASIDGQQIRAAVSSLTSAATHIEKTTAWHSDQADKYDQRLRQTVVVAGKAIQRTRDHAMTAIGDSAASAADVAAAKVDSSVTAVRTAAEKVERLTQLAEHLDRRLGWSAAARIALSVLPVCVVLLMGVQTVWAAVVGIRWALGQQWSLWVTITAAIALAGTVAGATFGLWRLAVWVRVALSDATISSRRRTR